jgi:hypothetical protein
VNLGVQSARFHEHVLVKLRKLEFLPSKADPDLWTCKLQDKYIAKHVDDVIGFFQNPVEIMKELKNCHCKAFTVYSSQLSSILIA